MLRSRRFGLGFCLDDNITVVVAARYLTSNFLSNLLYRMLSRQCRYAVRDVFSVIVVFILIFDGNFLGIRLI